MTNVVAVALLFFFSVASVANASGPSVSAQRLDDGTFVISGTATVKASADTVWGAITNFEQIPNFIPIITTSRVTSSKPLRLAQTMKISFSICGMQFSKSARIVYEVLAEQSPARNTVVFRRVSGGFKSLESSYVMEPDGDETRIAMSIVAVPRFWEATIVDAPMIARLAERQLSNLAAEVERRESLQLLAKSSTPVISSLQ